MRHAQANTTGGREQGRTNAISEDQDMNRCATVVGRAFPHDPGLLRSSRQEQRRLTRGNFKEGGAGCKSIFGERRDSSISSGFPHDIRGQAVGRASVL